jgi:hypothetical protein
MMASETIKLKSYTKITDGGRAEEFVRMYAYILLYVSRNFR